MSGSGVPSADASKPGGGGPPVRLLALVRAAAEGEVPETLAASLAKFSVVDDDDDDDERAGDPSDASEASAADAPPRARSLPRAAHCAASALGVRRLYS